MNDTPKLILVAALFLFVFLFGVLLGAEGGPIAVLVLAYESIVALVILVGLAAGILFFQAAGGPGPPGLIWDIPYLGPWLLERERKKEEND